MFFMKSKNIIKLFFMFFKISSLTIGGGYAMIPVIEDEIVNNFKFIERSKFYYIVAKSQAIPGVIAFNISLILGYEIAGFWGAFFSGIGVILPPFLIILIISIYYENFIKYKIINEFLYGVKVCLTAVMINLSYKLLKEKNWDPFSLACTFFLVFIYYYLKINPIILLILGVIIFFLKSKVFKEYLK
ncbi:MAG: chromate transporter [Spirochaetes bacterium]|nr:chromate transporter [Spirochaetota bacterium]